MIKVPFRLGGRRKTLDNPDRSRFDEFLLVHRKRHPVPRNELKGRAMALLKPVNRQSQKTSEFPN